MRRVRCCRVKSHAIAERTRTGSPSSGLGFEFPIAWPRFDFSLIEPFLKRAPGNFATDQDGGETGPKEPVGMHPVAARHFQVGEYHAEAESGECASIVFG